MLLGSWEERAATFPEHVQHPTGPGRAWAKYGKRKFGPFRRPFNCGGKRAGALFAFFGSIGGTVVRAEPSSRASPSDVSYRGSESLVSAGRGGAARCQHVKRGGGRGTQPPEHQQPRRPARGVVRSLACAGVRIQEPGTDRLAGHVAVPRQRARHSERGGGSSVVFPLQSKNFRPFLRHPYGPGDYCSPPSHATIG